MDMIRVRIKSVLPFLDSPYYRYLTTYPPKSIEFLGVSKKETLISRPDIFRRSLIFKTLGRQFLSLVKIPNFTFSIKEDADVIHCSHCLFLNNFPWVVDFEHFWTFSATSKISYSDIGRKIIAKFLKKGSCKRILPWTFAARKSLIDVIKDKEISSKCEVLYPAVPVFGYAKQNNIPTILFIGRYFYKKGGLFFLKAANELKKKYDIEAVLISFTIPKNIEEKYKDKIKIYRHVSRDELFSKFYPSSNIFVYPGFSDTFGFSLLEAMSFGIPIVTVNAFAREEIVNHEKTGFIVERPKNINLYKFGKNEIKLVKMIVEKTSLLIEDLSLRNKMSKNARKEIECGKFSICRRNKKLKKIYSEW